MFHDRVSTMLRGAPLSSLPLVTEVVLTFGQQAVAAVVVAAVMVVVRWSLGRELAFPPSLQSLSFVSCWLLPVEDPGSVGGPFSG